jgi:hypothetical protein
MGENFRKKGKKGRSIKGLDGGFQRDDNRLGTVRQGFSVAGAGKGRGESIIQNQCVVIFLGPPWKSGKGMARFYHLSYRPTSYVIIMAVVAAKKKKYACHDTRGVSLNCCLLYIQSNGYGIYLGYMWTEGMADRTKCK